MQTIPSKIKILPFKTKILPSEMMIFVTGGRSPDPIGDCTDAPGFNPPSRILYANSWAAPAASWREVPGDLWPGDENPSPWVFDNGSVAMQVNFQFKNEDSPI